MIWILFFAAIVSGALGEWVDAIAILAIVLLNGVIGFFQEERAEQALAALQRLSAPMRTELGHIAGMLQRHESEPTPLQHRLAELGRILIVMCLVIVGVIFALQVMRQGHLAEAFLVSVSLAVAAVPEGLPAVVTIALALGLQRMVKRNALVRKLPSVETLGSVTVIELGKLTIGKYWSR